MAVRSLEVAPAVHPFDEAPLEAVIVLGGGTSSTPWGAAQAGESGDRVLLAARLYHRGQTPILVTSGSPIVGYLDGHDSVEATAEIWRDLGIPEEAIVRVPGARNTREEARVHAALIRERGWSRVGLVSSAVHFPRAMGLFNAEGVTPVPLPADFRGTHRLRFPELYDLIPAAGSLALLERAGWERLGAAVGR
jgi:uncharacterized SAM-binding protein YcdF (DUF218 family)